MSREGQPGEGRELPFLRALRACRGDTERECELVRDLVRNVRLDVRTHDGMKAHDGSCHWIDDVDEIVSTVARLSSIEGRESYESDSLFEAFARPLAHSGDLWVSLSEEIRMLSRLAGKIISNNGGFLSCQVANDEDGEAVDNAMRIIAVKARAFYDLSQRQKDEQIARECARREAQLKEVESET
ncbi:MAG: hypothetical protein FWD69_01935 [Polyangiaceae bacterium]|nr:hypothetical protein [Polyangiaceae bacterium]